MSMRSGGEAALSLRDEAVVDRERERDSLRRLLFPSRDLDRFLDRSLSLDRDRDRLRFLLCLLLLECFDRDELRLRERPILTASATRAFTPNYCLMSDICTESGVCYCLLTSLFSIIDQIRAFQLLYFAEIIIKKWLLFCPTNSLRRKMAACRHL